MTQGWPRSCCTVRRRLGSTYRPNTETTIKQNTTFVPLNLNLNFVLFYWNLMQPMWLRNILGYAVQNEKRCDNLVNQNEIATFIVFKWKWMDVPASFDWGGGCYQEKATGGCHIYLSINTKHGQKNAKWQQLRSFETMHCWTIRYYKYFLTVIFL